MGLFLLLAMAFLGDAQNGEAKWGFICETRNSVNWRLPRGAVGWVGVRGFFFVCGALWPRNSGGERWGCFKHTMAPPGCPLAPWVCALRAFCIIKYWEGPPLPLPNHLETCFFGFPTPKKGGGRVPFTLWGTRAPHTLGVSVWGILAICQSSWRMRALYCPAQGLIAPRRALLPHHCSQHPKRAFADA